MSGGSFETSSQTISRLGKLIGFLLFAIMLALPAPDGMPPAAKRLLAVTALMSVLWMTQAIPIAATSLIPLVAFPLLGIQSAEHTSSSYINKNIFLFLGGFVIALGIEKWGLHRRMALHIVRVLGSGFRSVVLGFMLATAFLSMWISNTASTLLMLPIGLALLASLRELARGALAGTDEKAETQSPPAVTRAAEKAGSAAPRHRPALSADAEAAMARFSVVLMLGIAYAASIGGFTTLVGTPTNVQFQQIWSNEFPEAPELSAGQWMTAVVPLGVVFLLSVWGLLVIRLPAVPGIEQMNRSFFSGKLKELGCASRAEKLMLTVFAATAALWIFRTPLQFGSEPLVPGWGDWVEKLLVTWGTDPELADGAIHDSTVAVGMALLMFFIPGRRDEYNRVEYLMDWTTARKLPWAILLLIGGGFALAAEFSHTGLSDWIGFRFADAVAGWPDWMLVAATCLLLTMLTEVTSNVATVSAILPVLAGAAVSLGIDPRLIMIPGTISTSCAFMLPIATPPNAIVFGSGKIRMGQMVRYGVGLNLLGVVLITLATFWLLLPQLGISPSQLPSWAVQQPTSGLIKM